MKRNEQPAEGRRTGAALLSAVLAAGLLWTPQAAAASEREPAVEVNGTSLQLEASPYISHGHVMVPLREVGQALGGNVSWDQESRTATIRRDRHTAVMTAGNAEALKDGLAVTLASPPEIRQGRIYIPLRFSAESVGGTVTWHPSSGTASITMPLPSVEARAIIEETAEQTLAALKEKDWHSLAKLAHPDSGIRFSPYGYVDTANDRVVQGGELANLAEDSRTYVWGAFDGSGEPISLTFADYYERFVYSADFAQAPETGYNQFIGTGNTLNNARQVYPDAIIVEYHFDGFDPQYAGIDWQSLRLVFGKAGSEWKLEGIIHDEWTI